LAHRNSARESLGPSVLPSVVAPLPGSLPHNAHHCRARPRAPYAQLRSHERRMRASDSTYRDLTMRGGHGAKKKGKDALFVVVGGFENLCVWRVWLKRRKVKKLSTLVLMLP